MVNINDFGKYETAWCPGCGNFAILDEVKNGLVKTGLEPHQVVFVSGIGQAAKAPHYLNVNLFNGLHGRALPVATGIKLANPGLTVIAESGDGCTYGEGGNHFLAAIRRNINMTLIVHNNQVYALTKGQASPTSDEGFHTKTQPHGVAQLPFNPMLVAISMQAGFVARSFSGIKGHLSNLIKSAIEHPGFSLIDVLQPCISFNKTNNFAWYKKRCYELAGDYDPMKWEDAIAKGREWGEKIPIGIIYKNNRQNYEKSFPFINDAFGIADKNFNIEKFRKIVESYI